MESKNSIRLSIAANKLFTLSTLIPDTQANFCTYSKKSGFSMFIALSGLHAGYTLKSTVSSAAIFLCHSRLSIGSSVVQITFTLDLRMIFLTVIESSASFALQIFHTSSAVSPFNTP